jgi:Na+/phosphate symporter
LKIVCAANFAFSSQQKQRGTTFAHSFQHEFFDMKKLTISPVATLANAGSIFLFLLFFAACENEKKEIEALTKETETIHDEAMKDMADMNRVAREIKAFLISASMTPEQSAVYTETLLAIGKAEDDMMDWMKNYKSPEGMPPAEALKYLQEQKSLISKNQADIKAAMEAGKKLLGQ